MSRRLWLLVVVALLLVALASAVLGYETGGRHVTDEGVAIRMMLRHPPTSPPVDT